MDHRTIDRYGQDTSASRSSTIRTITVHPRLRDHVLGDLVISGLIEANRISAVFAYALRFTRRAWVFRGFPAGTTSTNKRTRRVWRV